LVEQLAADKVIGNTVVEAIGAQTVTETTSNLAAVTDGIQQPATPLPIAGALPTSYGDHQMALNIVENWSSEAGGVVVGIPVFISLLFCVIWSAVSTTVFGANVSTSTQTGFTIGSYVVTAGALLIALVAFLDTQNTKIKA
jgi:hypothetical protein